MGLVLAAMVAVAASGALAYRTGDASAFIRALGDQAIRVLGTTGSTLEHREASFRRLLHQGFDIPFIARFVLGRYWRTATPSQRDAYMSAFGDFIVATYSSRFGGYDGETLTLVSERPAGNKDVVVKSRIDRPSGPPIEADWRVRVTGDRIRIIDVMVEGVSMAITQRSEFASVIGRVGLNGLVEALRARTSKMPAVAASAGGSGG